MKKLMIAAAIVCAAVVSQGASVTWKWGGTIAQGYAGSSDAYAGRVYIYNANTITQQAVLNAFNAKNDWTASSLDSYTTANGKMGTTAAREISDDSKTFAPTRLDEGDKMVDFFYATVVTSGGEDYIFLSATGSVPILEGDDTVLSSSLSSASALKKTGKDFTAGGWYKAESVPEPTSAMLLLLGVAGLALRRRRA